MADSLKKLSNIFLKSQTLYVYLQENKTCLHIMIWT